MPLTFATRRGNLNWLWLLEVIVIVVVVLFYLFYFSRTFASLISTILRPILWRKYRIYLEIGSIQFSPLGGRLLFRDVVYVGENETIKITMGHITWRYWLWKVRQEEDLVKEDVKTPCRTSISVEGLEWFIYNRTSAFDLLLERLGHKEQQGKRGPHRQDKKDSNMHATDGGSSSNDTGSIGEIPQPSEVRTEQGGCGEIDWYRETFPIEIQVVRGALVMGNRSTPSLLVAGFRSASGTCGVVDSRSKYDLYKQIYQFTFDKPRIVFRKNHDYEASLTEYGQHLEQRKKETFGIDPRPDRQTLEFTYFQDFLKRIGTFADRVYSMRPYKDPVKEAWHGLARYRAAAGALYLEDDPPHAAPSEIQYGKVSTIYDNGESINLTYYADVAGFVPDISGNDKRRVLPVFEKPDIGNGDLAPEWGIDICLNGGTLTYGPWSDRQRADIQKAFFPPAYFTTQPTLRLKPGDRRLHAALKIFLDFSQTTTFRLPTREASKDWRYDGLADSMSFIDLEQRPYGWLDVKLGSESSVNFVMPMIADENGYDTLLEVHLDDILVSSSVNYEKFFKAKLCRLTCQLPAPLAWDSLHTWLINVHLDKPDLFLLRDHTYLLVDIVRDWTSGPPADFEQFMPFIYKLNLTFTDLNLYLYLNEQNIVNNAAASDDNTLLLITGKRVQAVIDLPLTVYKAPASTLFVKVETDDVELSMLPPASNTHEGFKTSRTKTFAKLDTMHLAIQHTVNAVTHPDNVETLDISIQLDGIMFQLLGWVIKYIISVKENYFGDHSHFVTLEEFRYKHSVQRPGDPLEQKYRPGKSDVFEVTLDVSATRSVALLPQEIYDCQSALALELPEFGVHLRNHDYFMELGVDVDPITLAFVSDCESIIQTGSLAPHDTSTRPLILDGLSINSHRLFGPQPRTAVYVAIWEFHLGPLVGDLSIPQISALQRVAQAFAVNFKDSDNSLSDDYAIPTDPDVTILSVTMESLEVNVWSKSTVVNITLQQGLSLKLDDHAGDGWLSHIDIDVPDLELKGLVPVDETEQEYLEVVALSAGAGIGLGKTAQDWEAKMHKQRKFLADQDASTQRCVFLYDKQGSDHNSVSLTSLHLPKLHPGEMLGTQHIDPPHTTGTADRTFQRLHGQHDVYVPRSRVESSRSRRTMSTTASGESVMATYSSLLRRFYRMADDTAYMALDGPSFSPGKPTESGSLPVAGTRNASGKNRIRSDSSAYRPQSHGEVLTCIDINCYKLVKGVCSPSAVRIASDIIATLEKNDNPEHWLDAAELEYRGRAGDTEADSTFTSIRVTSSLEGINLTLIQDILRPGDIDMAEHLESATHQDSAILSTSLLTLRKIDASFLQVTASASQFRFGSSRAQAVQQKMSVSTGKGRLQVRHVSRANSKVSRPPISGLPPAFHGAVLDVSMQSMTGDLFLSEELCKGAIEFGNSSLDFASSAAELVTGTVHSWFIVSRHIEIAVLKAQYRILPRYRRLFTDILRYSQDQGISTDPFFLNRPTIMPISTRADLSWKVLAHIRHNLRQLRPEAISNLRNDLLRNVHSVSEQDFRIVVPLLQEWHSWELDPQTIRSLTIFAYLFPRQANTSAVRKQQKGPMISWDTSFQFSITSGLFKVLHYDNARCSNQLHLTPNEIFAAYTGRTLAKRAGEGRIILRLQIGALVAELEPSFVQLVRHVGRVRRTFEEKLAPLIPRPRVTDYQSTPVEVASTVDIRYAPPASLPIDITMFMLGIDVSTRVRDVRASLALQSLHSNLSTKALTQSGETTIALDGQVFVGCDAIRFLSATEKTSQPLSTALSGSTLISIQLQDVHLCSALTADASKQHILAVTGVLGSSRVRVPRSVLRMSQFIDNWKTDSLPQSKIAFEELRRDLETARPTVVAAQTSTKRPLVELPGSIRMKANLLIPLVNFHIRAASKFWLDYTISDILLEGNSSLIKQRDVIMSAGLHVGTQTIAFVAVNEAAKQGESTPFEGQTIKLPAFNGRAKVARRHVEVIASLERIDITLTADTLDNVLAVQSRFEQDIDELLFVLAQRKARRNDAHESEKKPIVQTLPSDLTWNAQIALRGLNLGLRGPLATQYIGADLVEGYVSQMDAKAPGKITWEANALNLGASLARRRTGHSDKSHRDFRLAYFLLDVQAGNVITEVYELPHLSDSVDTTHLHIRLPKIHAVMQTATIETLDELIEHFSTEISRRKEARAKELRAIKARVIQTFDIPEKPSAPNVLPWIERCVLSLRVGNIGIVVPLADHEITVPEADLHSYERTHPAFMVSSTSLIFATSKGKAGFAKMADLSAQFVKQFDQTQISHFSGLHHRSQNRLTFPSAEITISSDRVATTRKKAFTVQAHMSGAELDIDAGIVRAVFSLVDLYEAGYQRLGRHAPDPAVLKAQLKEGVQTNIEAPEDYTSFIETTTFEAAFAVDSGIINMHNTLDPGDTASSDEKQGKALKAHHDLGSTRGRKRTTADRNRNYDGSASLPPDSFVIPKFSMWAAKREASKTGDDNAIHLDAVIHPSRNTLYPTLLPFLSDLSDAIKDRLQRQSSVVTRPGTPADQRDDGIISVQSRVNTELDIGNPISALRKLRISFSLRIDKSRLEISCLQAAQVSAILNWQSGGLIVTVEPGSRKAQVAIRVDEVNFDLKHTYSPEKCLGGSVQGLILAVSFGPQSDSHSHLSVNFRASSIAGEVNFRQLHDFLCFKAVWLDRLENLVPVPHQTETDYESALAPPAKSQSTTLITTFIVHLDELRFTCILGSNIGTVDLSATALVGRVRLVPLESRALSVDLKKFSAVSKGRLSGSFTTNGLYFENSYRDPKGPVASQAKNLVKLSAWVGAMDAFLEFDYRRVLLVRSDPIQIGATDDWKDVMEQQILHLNFWLRFGGLRVILTTQTVPTLVRLATDVGKLIEDRSIKARNTLFGLETYLATPAPRAKLQWAAASAAWKQKRTVPSMIPEGVRVASTIHLEAERLRLAIFLHHFTDAEAFRGDAGAVRAHLERGVDESSTVARDLNLHLGFFTIRKLRPKKVSPLQERDFTLEDWFEVLGAASERNIVQIPTSEAKMTSTQKEHSNQLYHRFTLAFTGQVDISLNYALLKQLGDLLNAYQEGMKRNEQRGHSRTAPPTPSIESNAVTPAFTSGDDQDQPNKQIGAEKVPAPPSIAVIQSLEYIALENNIQQPQLQLLGDATPPMEWLGVQRGHFPGWVHGGVTTILEQMLLELTAVYKRSLAHGAAVQNC